ERVRCLPGDQLFRVRSLQVHGRSVDRAGWGQRVALNLTGAERAAIERGHVICNEKLSLATHRFDAFMEVRPSAAKGIKNHQRVRVHQGAAERLAKIILLGSKEKAEPKESTYCQVTLSEPLLVLRGDHFIVRDETGQRTLGGGTVIHPWARKHKRGDPGLPARLEALHIGDLQRLTETFLDESEAFALPLETIHQFLNLQEDQARSCVDPLDSVLTFSAEGEKVYTTKAKWARLREAMITTLERFHASHPLVPGMDMEELRGKLIFALSPKLFRVLVEALVTDKTIVKEENLLRLPGHHLQVGGQEKLLMDKIKNILGEQPMAPPDLKQIEKNLGVSRAKLNDVLRLLEREGSVARVATDLYFLTTCVDKVRGVLYKFLTDKGEISAAAFRDLLGSSRKYTIALLEYFDREGFTLRIGDIRRLKSNAQSIKTRVAKQGQ
ncbi:MAG TPA: SelB C-terminal domain-containing protein, partial [Terriglobales bacterium]|nr:SelB C-terminal domain-containing protein [Terriglobales bacterium]